MIVEPTHLDYKNIKERLKCFTDKRGIAEGSILDLTSCEAALKVAADDSNIPDLLDMNSSAAYTIKKAALSQQGVTIEDLAAFAALEIRLMNVEKYMRESFTQFVLCERQDGRVRYEISDRDLKISTIFSSIEYHKSRLQLADYSVSQTSLEQVFNKHAAEAEQQKTGRFDHNMAREDNVAKRSCNVETIGTLYHV